MLLHTATNQTKIMNMQLSAVYFCATGAHRWGRGLTIQDALKQCGLAMSAMSAKNPPVDFYIKAALYDNPSDDELKNLCTCICGNPIDGNPMYYNDGRTKEDTDMINKHHVGWVTIHKTKGVS